MEVVATGLASRRQAAASCLTDRALRGMSGCPVSPVEGRRPERGSR